MNELKVFSDESEIDSQEKENNRKNEQNEQCK